MAMEEMEMLGSGEWGGEKGCVEEVEVAGLFEVVKVGDKDRRGIKEDSWGMRLGA